MTVDEYIKGRSEILSNTTIKSEKSRLFKSKDIMFLPVDKMVKILLGRYKRNTAHVVYMNIKSYLIDRRMEFEKFESDFPSVWRFSYIGREQKLSEYDVAGLLDLVEHKNYALFNAIVLMAYGGLRWSEALKLNWTDIISLDKDVTKLHIVQSKGRKDRFVYINSNFIALLKNIDNKPVNIPSGKLRHAWYKHIGRNIIPHSLRAYAITSWANKTPNLKLIAEQAGHSSITTTLNYIRLSEKDKKELVQNDEITKLK